MTPTLTPTTSGDWLSLAGEHDPERFRAAIASAPNRQRVRWLRAFPATTYELESGDMSYEPGRQDNGVTYVEVPEAVSSWVQIETAEKFAKRFAPGQIAVGAMMCISMSDEFPFADGDILIPLGKSVSLGVPDTAWRTEKRVLMRGATREPLAGTVSITGKQVTGVGTTFLDDVGGGDIIEVLGEKVLVHAATSQTRLTLTENFPGSPTGANWARCVDKLPEWPAIRLEAIMRGRTLMNRQDFELGSYGDRILWPNPAAAPSLGERFSVIWDYLPRYMVREVQGYSRGVPVQGRAMPQMVMIEQVGGKNLP